jgi:hypothetical protein
MWLEDVNAVFSWRISQQQQQQQQKKQQKNSNTE